MKRLLLLLLCAAVLLTGCARQETPTMFIRPALLTAQEEQILALSSQGGCSIFDFQLSEGAHTLTIQVYRLEGNQWAPYTATSSLNLTAQDGKGRFALHYSALPGGIVTTVVDEKGGVLSMRQGPAEIPPVADGLHVTTSTLSGTVEIHYDEEIPLALQIISSQLPEENPGAITLRPEELAAQGHEYVFYVTAAFARGPLE